MKKISLLLIAAAISTSCLAQRNKLDIGVEGGPSLVSLRGKYINEDYKPALSFCGGLFIQYNFKKIFSIRTGLAFEKKGDRYESTVRFTDYMGNLTGTDKYTAHRNLNYLTLPLLARLSFGKKVNFFVNAGPYLGYLIKSTGVMDANRFNPKTKVDITSETNRFDYGICGGLGLALPIGSKFALSFEARHSLGLQNIIKNPYSDFSVKTNASTLIIGLAYKLGARS